jgi:hypothetical protein
MDLEYNDSINSNDLGSEIKEEDLIKKNYTRNYFTFQKIVEYRFEDQGYNYSTHVDSLKDLRDEYRR